MTHVKRFLVLASVAGVAAAGSAALAADQTFLPVNVCSTGGNVLTSGHTAPGVGNGSTTGTATVRCGIGQNQGLDPNDDVRIYYADRNAASGKNFVCHAYSRNADNSTVLLVGPVYGCVTPGGCPSDPGVFAAESYLTLPDVQHGGAMTASVVCSIPQFNVEYSFVKSLVLDE